MYAADLRPETMRPLRRVDSVSYRWQVGARNDATPSLTGHSKMMTGKSRQHTRMNVRLTDSVRVINVYLKTIAKSPRSLPEENAMAFRDRERDARLRQRRQEQRLRHQRPNGAGDSPGRPFARSAPKTLLVGDCPKDLVARASSPCSKGTVLKNSRLIPAPEHQVLGVRPGHWT